jgi:hypothetical protein
MATHPTWFKEKSGGDACCCAATSGANAAQTKLVKTPPAKNLPLEKRLDIVPSSWVVRYRLGVWPARPWRPSAPSGATFAPRSSDPLFANKPQFTALRFVSHAAKHLAGATAAMLSIGMLGFISDCIVVLLRDHLLEWNRLETFGGQN